MPTLACVQFTPTYRNVADNIERIGDIIASVNADVIVFPELATSGYLFSSASDVQPFALRPESPEIYSIIQAGEQSGASVIIGFPELADEGVYNSALVCSGGVILDVYRKVHLFSNEKDVFLPGNLGFRVVELSHLDLRLGTMICFDWRFPEAARLLALAGADLIACPSNLVTPLWPIVMPARAIENKVYLAVANRTGIERTARAVVEFGGKSAVYDYEGSVITQAGNSEDIILTAEIYPSRTRDKAVNDRNNIFEDRRPEMYGGLV